MLKTNTLPSKWLTIIRAAWVAIVLSTIVLIASHLPSIYNRSTFICDSIEDCSLHSMFTTDEMALLPDQGNALINFMLAFDAISALVWFGVALAIFWMKSDEIIGLVSSLFLVTFHSSIISGYILAYPGELTYLIKALLISVGQSFFLLVIYIFPDGKFTPRWSRWIGFILLLVAVNISLALLREPEGVMGSWFTILFFSLFLLGVVLQIYRYFKVSTVIQRQQTKWVVVAIAMLPISDLLLRRIILPGLFPAVMVPGQTHIIWNAITIPLFRTVPFLMIPVAFAFSILKYRLWDIDVLIRRTLVYSALTGLLGFLYFTGVALLQGMLNIGKSTANSTPPAVVIVLSTLAIAALANPLRRRLQDLIDRRFYRQKYDAEKALAEFAAAARSETDLTQLAGRLTVTVQETMQPSRSSLWLQNTGNAKASHKK